MKRIVKFTDARTYELLYEALAGFQPTKLQEAAAEGAFEKLSSIGVEKEKSANPDLVLLKLAEGKRKVELLESERDLLVTVLEGLRLPVYALALRKRARSILDNAEKVEEPEEATPPMLEVVK